MELVVWSQRVVVVKVESWLTVKVRDLWNAMLQTLKTWPPGMWFHAPWPSKSVREGMVLPRHTHAHTHTHCNCVYRRGNKTRPIQSRSYYEVMLFLIKCMLSGCLMKYDGIVLAQGCRTRERPCLPPAPPPPTSAAGIPSARNLWNRHDICWSGRHERTYPSLTHSALQHGRHPHQLQGTGTCITCTILRWFFLCD